VPSVKNAYKRVRSGCTRACSLNPENLPVGVGELVHKWFEEGCNNQEIIDKAFVMGAKLSNGSVGRHRKSHLHRDQPVAEDGSDPDAKYGEIELLDEMIQAGGRQLKLGQNKVTAEQMLRAIELKMRLTEGSVFDAMFAAMAGEGDEDLSELMDDGGEDPLPQDPDGTRQGR